MNVNFFSIVPWTLLAQWFNIFLLIALIIVGVRFFGRINRALKKYLNEK